MNTAKSVAYGWVALIVAAGGSYYYAKKDLKGRKLDPALREARLGQGGSSSSGNITCESALSRQDKLKEFETTAQAKANASTSAGTSNPTTFTSTVSGEPSRPANRNLSRDVEMNSKPTGVDTSTSGPGAVNER